MSFNYVEGESLLMAIKGHRGLERVGLHVGQPGAVLRSQGAGAQRRARAQLDPLHDRPLHHEEEIDFAVQLIKGKVAKLREMSPLWEMVKEGVDLNTVQWAAH